MLVWTLSILTMHHLYRVPGPSPTPRPRPSPGWLLLACLYATLLLQHDAFKVSSAWPWRSPGGAGKRTGTGFYRYQYLLQPSASTSTSTSTSASASASTIGNMLTSLETNFKQKNYRSVVRQVNEWLSPSNNTGAAVWQKRASLRFDDTISVSWPASQPSTATLGLDQQYALAATIPIILQSCQMELKSSNMDPQTKAAIQHSLALITALPIDYIRKVLTPLDCVKAVILAAQAGITREHLTRLISEIVLAEDETSTARKRAVNPPLLGKLTSTLTTCGFPDLAYLAFLWRTTAQPVIAENSQASVSVAAITNPEPPELIFNDDVVYAVLNALLGMRTAGLAIPAINRDGDSPTAIVSDIISEKVVQPLEKAAKAGLLKVGMVVKALAVSRAGRQPSWQCAMAVYTFAKHAALAGEITDLNATVSTCPAASQHGRINGSDSAMPLSLLPAIIYGQTITILGKAGAEQQTFQVLNDMLESGATPSSTTLDFTFLELSKRGAYPVLLSMVDRLTRYRVPLTPTTKHAVLNACNKGRAYQIAWDFYEQHMNASELDTIAVSTLLKCCDRLKAPHHAAKIFIHVNSLQNHQQHNWFTPAMLERLFAIFVNNNSPTLAMQVLLYLEHVAQDSSTQTEALNELIASFSILLTKTDIEPFTTLEISDPHQGLVSTQNEDLSLLESLVDQVVRLDHLPIVESEIYSAAISCLRLSGLPELSCHLIWGLIDRGGGDKITSSMVSSALHGYRYSRDHHGATQFFRQMESFAADQLAQTQLASAQDSPPSPLLSLACYNTLLLVYAVCKTAPGMTDLVDHLLLEMKRKGLGWDVYTYNALVMFNDKQPETVIKLWHKLQSASLVPTTAIIQETLKACAEIKEGNLAWEILNYSSQYAPFVDDSMGVTSVGHAATTASTVAVQARGGLPVVVGSDTNAHKTKSKWEEFGVRIDMNMYLNTLRALYRQGDQAKLMLMLLSKMLERGIQPSEPCYNVVIQALESTTDWQDSLKLVLKMARKGMTVNVKLFNIVMSTCAKNQQFDIVLKLFDSLAELVGPGGGEATSSTFSVAVMSAIKLRDLDKAMKLLSIMTEKGLMPSPSTIGQLITALEASERYEESSQVFERTIACHLPVEKSRSSLSDHQESSMLPIAGDMILDLHGYTIPVARACIRSALALLRREAIRTWSWRMTTSLAATLESPLARNSPQKDYRLTAWKKNSETGVRNLVIITGYGKNSKEWLEPILKPSTKQWLFDDFSPPLVAQEVAENPGRLVLSGLNIYDWALSSQQTWLSRTFIQEVTTPIVVHA